MNNFYLCEETLHMLHLTENMELINNDSLEYSYYNIMNGSNLYEWDIIHIFKNYDFYISGEPKNYPPCSCPICSYCSEGEKNENVKVLRSVIYIKEFLNTMCDPLIKDKTIPFIRSEGGSFIKKRIEEYYDYLDGKNFKEIKIWPEKNAEFEQIFGLPRIFYKAGIDKDFYQKRKNSHFESQICGNPMASHGWFWESLIGMRELYAGKNLSGFDIENID